MMILIMSVFVTCMVMTAVITDITRYIIPNLIVVIILLVYPTILFLAPVMPDWKVSLIIGLITFLVGFALFALRIMGGGDVKLLAVLTMFAGKEALPEFLMYIAILGGALSILLLASRPMVAYTYSKIGRSPTALPRILTVNEPIPYGVAIGLSFLFVLWSGKIAGIAL